VSEDNAGRDHAFGGAEPAGGRGGGLAHRRYLPCDPVIILLDVRRVHHEHEVVRSHPVDEHVVDERAGEVVEKLGARRLGALALVAWILLLLHQDQIDRIPHLHHIIDQHLDEPNVNMVTCGGQATIPMVAAVSRVAKVQSGAVAGPPPPQR